MSVLMVDVLAALFGISSWIEINGLWTELPVMVHDLPESWELASYIVFVSQLANLGPILFGILRRRYSQKVIEVPAIHITMVIGVTSCILLALFWHRTVHIGKSEYSVALFLLTFALALIDCTSSVLYLPFMANLRERFVFSYLIGEGLSGLLPSVIALGQGVGGNPECLNVTTHNETKTIAYHTPPRFSVSVYFVTLGVMVVVSWLAFAMLNRLPSAKHEWVTYTPVTHPPNPVITENFMASEKKDMSSSTETTPSTEHLILKKNRIPTVRYVTLLAIQAYVSFIHNVLLSVQTYSCLPYGNMAYHLAVTLSGISTPLLCFVAMFFSVKSIKSLLLLTCFASGWGSYVLYTALTSPTPPLVGLASGYALVVLSWICLVGTMAYVKACVASNFRREGGHSALFYCGVVTQIGSAIGAVLTFVLVNYAEVFHLYSPCT